MGFKPHDNDERRLEESSEESSDSDSSSDEGRRLGLMNISCPDQDLYGRLEAEGFPLSKDWVAEGKVTAMRNQSSCGSCWAFSYVGAVESAYLIKNNLNVNNGDNIDLSEQQMVDCTCNSSWCSTCSGGWMTEAHRENSNVHYENDYPYVGQDQTCIKNNNDPLVNVKSQLTTVTDGSLYDFIVKLNTAPLTVAFHANSNFMGYESGIINLLDRAFCKEKTPNHAVLAVGYHIDKVNPENSFMLFKNQWGTNWGGIGGYFKFSLPNLEFFCRKRNTLKTRKLTPCGILNEGEETFFVEIEDN